MTPEVEINKVQLFASILPRMYNFHFRQKMIVTGDIFVTELCLLFYIYNLFIATFSEVRCRDTWRNNVPLEEMNSCGSVT